MVIDTIDSGETTNSRLFSRQYLSIVSIALLREVPDSTQFATAGYLNGPK